MALKSNKTRLVGELTRKSTTGQALYRNYRPRTFSEVVGQEPVTDTLKKALKSGRISHAYLFSGPRGVGKTSVARILAHEVNDLPYKGESFHLDIIEVDAASNRRIDEIRDIREKVHIAPTSGKYKVYIIDEVHMLTKEAFNALLKTLEEPPAHCIFILATTEAHKLPATIISRTQHYNFKPVQQDKATAHLKNIAAKEKIDIEPAALELLAQHADGSLRDSISFLDQLSASGRKITEPRVRELLGLPPADGLGQLTQAIRAADPKTALGLLNDLRVGGVSAARTASELGKKLRDEVLANDEISYERTPRFLKDLLGVNTASQPFELLELLVLEAALNGKLRVKLDEPVPPMTDKVTEEQENLALVPENQTVTTDLPANGFSLELWPEVLAVIKARAASIYTALRLATPKLDGDALILEFQFPLHKDKLSQARHVNFVGDVIKEVSGAQMAIKSVVVPRAVKAVASTDTQGAKKIPKTSDELATISNIFGSAEMLE